MATQVPDETFVVYWHLLDWEETNNEDLFTSFFDQEDILLMLFEVLKAIKIDNPPDLATETNDWALFILNVFVEFAADFGVNNIKSIITNPDRWAIADAAEITIGQDPSTWPINNFSWHQNVLNSIVVPE